MVCMTCMQRACNHSLPRVPMLDTLYHNSQVIRAIEVERPLCCSMEYHAPHKVSGCELALPHLYVHIACKASTVRVAQITDSGTLSVQLQV